jgi:hypothetical protein
MIIRPARGVGVRRRMSLTCFTSSKTRWRRPMTSTSRLKFDRRPCRAVQRRIARTSHPRPTTAARTILQSPAKADSRLIRLTRPPRRPLPPARRAWNLTLRVFSIAGHRRATGRRRWKPVGVRQLGRPWLFTIVARVRPTGNSRSSSITTLITNSSIVAFNLVSSFQLKLIGSTVSISLRSGALPAQAARLRSGADRRRRILVPAHALRGRTIVPGRASRTR